jgi:hypothetical protein
VTVVAQDDEATEATDDDDHTITGSNDTPFITIDKSAPPTVSEGGELVTYSFTITAAPSNASTDPLTVTALTDTVFGDLLEPVQNLC